MVSTVRPLAVPSLALLLAAVFAPTCRRPPESTAPGPSTRPSPAALAPGELAEARAAVRGIVAAGRHPALLRPDFGRYQAEMEGLYAPGGDAPVWFEGSRPRPQAGDVVAVLREAETRGLSPADYDADRLERWLGAAAAGAGLAPAEIGRFDAALSLVFMRHLSDVHVGRVDPRSVKVAFDVEPRRVALRQLVRDAIAGDRVRAVVEEAEPSLGQYRRLKKALAGFRRLATDASLVPVPEVKKLSPGDEYPGAPALGRLLVALGDLAPDALSPPPVPGTLPRYEGALVEAVRRFQERHGLNADGVVGRGTFALLNLTMARRVRLIELALERLRWLPLPADGPVVIVNLAGFRLWAIERSGGEPRPWLTMRVVVGRALRSQTPLLGEELRFVIFRPYWNIPPAITRNETLPAARRDPGYLVAQDMELVAGDRDDSPVVPATAENLARVGPGGLRIRQRPGPRNSLGRVKFVFPNNANVYLHDTPARGLFARDRRDLSHGCVRVAEPVALAEWVLRGVPGWTRERIEKAMTAGPPQQVNLPVPIPVLLFYATATVDAQGQAAFFEDIYGHDRRLEERLRGEEPRAP